MKKIENKLKKKLKQKLKQNLEKIDSKNSKNCVTKFHLKLKHGPQQQFYWVEPILLYRCLGTSSKYFFPICCHNLGTPTCLVLHYFAVGSTVVHIQLKFIFNPCRDTCGKFHTRPFVRKLFIVWIRVRACRHGTAWHGWHGTARVKNFEIRAVPTENRHGPNPGLNRVAKLKIEISMIFKNFTGFPRSFLNTKNVLYLVFWINNVIILTWW